MPSTSHPLIDHAWSVILAAPPSFFELFYLLTLVASLMLAVGFMTRFASVAVWVLVVSWINPLSLGSNGADMMIRVLAFLTMVAAVMGHAQCALSVDRWIAERKTPAASWSEKIPAWTTRLFQIQLVLIYFFSGWFKSSGPDWINGTALHYVLNQGVWSRFDVLGMSAHPVLIGLLTYGSLLFELILFPALVWPLATRIPILIGGLLFHLGIGISMRIIMFTEVMPVFYLVFLEEEHILWIWDRVKKVLPAKRR